VICVLSASGVRAFLAQHVFGARVSHALSGVESVLNVMMSTLSAMMGALNGMMSVLVSDAMMMSHHLVTHG